MTIHSEAITLKQIADQGLFFQIPIYQRLYVWGDEQVRTLLDDLWAAYKAGQDIAYLGGILVVERRRNGESVEYDLVDGQQRFTTLWLTALVFGGGLVPFLAETSSAAPRLRLGFPIRPDIEHAFREGLQTNQAPVVAELGIDNALGVIRRFHRACPQTELDGFTRYVFNAITFVMTRFPPTMDLNKMFEVINNRGVQLQHHDILKSRLLHFIRDSEERERYAALWESCAYMDDYVERNWRRITRLDAHTLFTPSEAKRDNEALAVAKHVLLVMKSGYKSQQKIRQTSLLSILRTSGPDASGDEEPLREVNDGAKKIRSIISFSMLLQHTLRIWLHSAGRSDLPRVHDKDLLALFDDHFFASGCGYSRVTEFMALLWEIRYCFDKHVIKWVEVDGEEHHLILKTNKRKTESPSGKEYMSLVREEGGDQEFALLQSMLYHSQQLTTHYWLTPFLARMHSLRGSRDSHLQYLRHLDNHLLCTTDDRSLAERSRQFMENPLGKSTLIEPAEYFKQELGLKFPHYWFYKLEFVLWSTNAAELKDSQRASFRMTAKNSVEHISPQTAQSIDKNTVSEGVLDSFGNLALVSRGINSEYGNKPFNEKRAHFWNKNGDRIDSLKMKLVYENERWGDSQAKSHQKAMIALLTDYLVAN